MHVRGVLLLCVPGLRMLPLTLLREGLDWLGLLGPALLLPLGLAGGPSGEAQGFQQLCGALDLLTCGMTNSVRQCYVELGALWIMLVSNVAC